MHKYRLDVETDVTSFANITRHLLKQSCVHGPSTLVGEFRHPLFIVCPPSPSRDLIVFVYIYPSESVPLGSMMQADMTGQETPEPSSDQRSDDQTNCETEH